MRFTEKEVWAVLQMFPVVDLVRLTAAQGFDATRKYAQAGGISARLYDRLIGEVAIVHSIRRIVTWNVSHMRRSAPFLKVVTPAQAAGAPG